MEEDTPGLRHSNSAPDLHVMLQEPLQSMPRMLLGPRQQPLGSSSAVGALVPYTANSTKVRSPAHSPLCRMSIPRLTRQTGQLAVSMWLPACMHASCLTRQCTPILHPRLLCPGSGRNALLRRPKPPLRGAKQAGCCSVTCLRRSAHSRPDDFCDLRSRLS